MTKCQRETDDQPIVFFVAHGERPATDSFGYNAQFLGAPFGHQDPFADWYTEHKLTYLGSAAEPEPPKIDLDSERLRSIVAALGAERVKDLFDTSWIMSYTETPAARRKAQMRRLVSELTRSGRNDEGRRELLLNVVRSLSDVWTQLEELGYAGEVRRAINLLLTVAKRSLSSVAIVARALVARARTLRPDRESVLVLSAPNPPTFSPGAIPIAAGMLA